MSDVASARDLLEAVGGFIQDPTQPGESATRNARLATIDAAYSGVGRPRVRFDGEATTGTRTYVTLAPVAPGQRVVLLPVGSTYVVLGGVDGGLKMAEGTATTPAVGPAVGANVNVAITFPVGLFATPPSVMSIAGNGRLTMALSTAVTTTGVTLQANNWSNAQAPGLLSLHWLAIGD